MFPTFPLFVSKAQIAKCKGQLCQQNKTLHLPNGNQQKGLSHLHLGSNLTRCSVFSQLCFSGSLR